jgi:hypothetical protein
MNWYYWSGKAISRSGFLKEQVKIPSDKLINQIFKHILMNFFIAIISIVFVAASCKSKAQKDAEKYMNEIEKTVKENSPANDDNQKTNAASPNIPDDLKNIIGEWNLVRTLRDDNGNHVIDGDEEKTAIENSGYMKLNADGTCKFQTVMDGTYKIITEEEGRRNLAIQDLQGTKYPMKLFIVSVTDQDLVLNTVLGGSGFEIYKRP